MTFPAGRIDRAASYRWAEEIVTPQLAGDDTIEIVFFHYPSETFLVIVLNESFKAMPTDGLLLGWLMRLGGIAAHGGYPPRDLA